MLDGAKASRDDGEVADHNKHNMKQDACKLSGPQTQHMRLDQQYPTTTHFSILCEYFYNNNTFF